MQNLNRDAIGSSDWRIRSADAGWIAIAFLTPILVYLPVVLAEYGFSESWRLLAFYINGPAVRKLVLAEGRPLYALWGATVFGFLSGSIRALSVVRFMNLCTIGAAAVLISRILQKAGLRTIDATLVGIATMMLPSFQLFAGMAGIGNAPLAAVLACIAVLSVHRLAPGIGPARQRDPGISPAGASAVTTRSGLRSLIAPTLWLVAAQAAYQPAAMMYFAFAAVLLLLPELERIEFRGRFIRYAIPGLTALVVEFILFQAGKSFFPRELLGAPRASLNLDPFAKLAWFFGLPMAHATNPWVLRPHLLFGVLLTIAVSAGLSVRMRASEDRWLKLALAFALIPFCYLPNLAVAENHPSFRSQPALASLLLFFCIIIVYAALRTKRTAFSVLMVAMTAFGCVMARKDVSAYIVRPQVRELQLVRQTLNAMPRGYHAIGLRKADYRDTLAPAVFYDEFGYPSTALPWSFIEITQLVLREQLPPGSPVPALVDVLGAATRDAPAAPPTVVPDTIIDWGVVLRAERDRSAAR
jgi:hypothetical protein